jgi:sulfate adenylyltransferase
MTSHLAAPHGGSLNALMAAPGRAQELKEEAKRLPSWALLPRQSADVEALLTGAFSPLAGFLARKDHDSVLAGLRLANGTFWPLPVALDVAENVAKDLKAGSALALRDPEGVLIAVLRVEETWQADRESEAKALYGTTDISNPGAFRLLRDTRPFYVSGRLEGVELPRHYDAVELRATPAELRERLARLGWRTVAAFVTEGVMHRAEQELTLAACRALEADLLIQLAEGVPQAGSAAHYSRVRCLSALTRAYPRGTAQLAIAPLVSRRSGLRDVLLSAIVAQNHGASHLIVRQSALAGASPSDLERYQGSLGIRLVPTAERVYVPEKGGYLADPPKGAAVQRLTNEELADRLAHDHEIPSWFSFPEIVRELKRTYPPRAQQGFTVFFTGLPSSGKSTIANVLLVKLMEIGGRPVTILDGDVVRKHLSSELGFSREHRDINIRRIGYVASEITKNGGIAICAPIAPYDAVRKEVRAMIEPVGGFLLVHVATPLEVCEQRDRKGLYAKARAGIVKEFTGISDPYEVPQDAGLAIDTTERSPEECVQAILLHLEKEGYIGTTAAEGLA